MTIMNLAAKFHLILNLNLSTWWFFYCTVVFKSTLMLGSHETMIEIVVTLPVQCQPLTLLHLENVSIDQMKQELFFITNKIWFQRVLIFFLYFFFWKGQKWRFWLNSSSVNLKIIFSFKMCSLQHYLNCQFLIRVSQVLLLNFSYFFIPFKLVCF